MVGVRVGMRVRDDGGGQGKITQHVQRWLAFFTEYHLQMINDQDVLRKNIFKIKLNSVKTAHE